MIREQSSTATFRHGVHPLAAKDQTAALAIERMPFVDRYVVPLSQHIGKPAIPMVQPGARVHRGQMIARPDGFISTAIHAPVSGRVDSIDLQPHPSGKLMAAVVLLADPFDPQAIVPSEPGEIAELSRQETVDLVQQSGMVGLGGAAFPSHVKFALPDGKRVQSVILNGCECEPYLTCDHRVMVEEPAAVLDGLRIMMDKLQAKRGYVGIEDNKLDAVYRLRELVDPTEDIEIVPLKVKYPQGAEKMLLDAIFHREVPTGKLPLDLEMVVNNVGTAAALSHFFRRGIPLVERIVTISGPAIQRPKNLIVPIGTPIRDVLKHCAVDWDHLRQVIMGGPMMGSAQKNLDAPIVKGSSGLLCFTEPLGDPLGELPCIRCSRCLDACPMFLNPSRLAMMIRAEWLDEMKQHHLQSCFECAACSYVCPSRIPLVHLMRLGKALLRHG